MHRLSLQVFGGIAALLLWATLALAQGSSGQVQMRAVVTDLKAPWGFDFLPGGGILITEKPGRLWLWQDGRKRAVSGLPEVAVRGQGGLLDVAVARDFARTGTIFMTLARDLPAGGSNTALISARLDPGNARLSAVELLFQAQPGGDTGRHFGSRVVEARDGRLFVTVGDRGNRPAAQDRSSHTGSILRLNRDGSVPRDNPFVGQGNIRPEIWSYGHRNPQGAALDLHGNLWTAEHGAKGGDEVNRIRKGANFGWPVISYGRHYSGGKIGEGTAKPGMQQPAFYWDPSIAPSGLMIYSGALWPQWRGHFFVGSLKLDHISRLSGQPLQEAERLQAEETLRVRALKEGPQGAIWFLSEGKGALYRMTPAPKQ